MLCREGLMRVIYVNLWQVDDAYKLATDAGKFAAVLGNKTPRSSQSTPQSNEKIELVSQAHRSNSCFYAASIAGLHEVSTDKVVGEKLPLLPPSSSAVQLSKLGQQLFTAGTVEFFSLASSQGVQDHSALVCTLQS